jgi:isopropylmalate/homocitrate/citramalate synthase
MMYGLPVSVRIVEVGPRDGLQNEKAIVPLAAKVGLVDRLADCGISMIETGSFVSPKWIPQMADSEQVFQQIRRLPGVRYTALTPNLQGLERALACQVSEVAVFAAASETFSQRNINCSIIESIERFSEVCKLAGEAGVPVRGYVSCALGCPYEGEVAPQEVAKVVNALKYLGCYEVSIGDTIGIGTPARVQEVIDACLPFAAIDQMAVHFHDTYGQALANILAALQMGISCVDSSVAGLGGCPYASGASGNVATEDVVFMLHGMGIETGIDLEALLQTSQWICRELNRANHSKVTLARLGSAPAQQAVR